MALCRRFGQMQTLPYIPAVNRCSNAAQQFFFVFEGQFSRISLYMSALLWLFWRYAPADKRQAYPKRSRRRHSEAPAGVLIAELLARHDMARLMGLHFPTFVIHEDMHAIWTFDFPLQ